MQAAARLKPMLVHAVILSCSQLQGWTQSTLNTKGIADSAPDRSGGLNTSQIQQQLQGCNSNKPTPKYSARAREHQPRSLWPAIRRGDTKMETNVPI